MRECPIDRLGFFFCIYRPLDQDRTVVSVKRSPISWPHLLLTLRRCARGSLKGRKHSQSVSQPRRLWRCPGSPRPAFYLRSLSWRGDGACRATYSQAKAGFAMEIVVILFQPSAFGGNCPKKGERRSSKTGKDSNEADARAKNAIGETHHSKPSRERPLRPGATARRHARRQRRASRSDNASNSAQPWDMPAAIGSAPSRTKNITREAMPAQRATRKVSNASIPKRGRCDTAWHRPAHQMLLPRFADRSHREHGNQRRARDEALRRPDARGD